MSPSPIVDAYMHVGEPRFGSAAQALRTLDLWGTAQTVLVLGPGVPDVAALAEAQSARPDAIRTVGIPYGATAEERLACARACFAAGATGLRLQRDEPLDNPAIMDELGERGGWAYATDPLFSPQHTAFYLQWLERYPRARIGAPHFLRLDLSLLDGDLAQALLGHPRFYPIFSRHGQCGSREPYPHLDLRPWVEQVIARCGWERIMWGSEYPVLYWRGEQIDGARRWIDDLGVDLSPAARAAYLGGNAARLLFDTSPPPVELIDLPAWLRDFPSPRPVTLAPTGPVDLPVDVYRPLFDDYLRHNGPGAPLTFIEYCVGQLRIRAEALHREMEDDHD